MIAALLVAFGIATAAAEAPAPAEPALLQDASHAIAVGRLDQARLMIGKAIASGAAGPSVERILADFAFASGNYAEALARYRQLAVAGPRDASVCEQAG